MRSLLIGAILGVVVGEAASSALAADTNRPDTPAQAMGEYFIGVACTPLPPVLRAQLSLPENQGVLVGNLLADSPGAKAGLRENDLILKAGGKAVARPEELVSAINAGQGKPLSLTLLRGGKEVQVEVTPIRRDEFARGSELRGGEESDWAAVRQWLDRFGPGELDRGPLRFHIVRPGAITAGPPQALPDDTTMIITRHGSEPAKIVVEKGDKRYEATEKELDKLPADIRQLVEMQLRPMFGGHPIMRLDPNAANWRNPETRGEPTNPPAGDPVPRQLDQMRRQIRDMEKSLEELRQRSTSSNDPNRAGRN